MRLLLTALLVLTVTQLSPAQTGPRRIPIEQRVPGSVVGLFTIPDCQAAWKRLQASNYGPLLQHPEFPVCAALLDQKLFAGSGLLQDHPLESISSLGSILHGEFTHVGFSVAEREYAWVTLIDCGPNQPKCRELLRRFEDKQQKRHRSEQVVEGVKVIVWETVPAKPPEDIPQPCDEEGDTGPLEPLAYFLHDGYLAISDNVRGLEAILRRWDGSHADTFASNSTWTHMRQRCGDQSPVAMFYADRMLTFLFSMMAGEFGEISDELAANVLAYFGSIYSPLALEEILEVGGVLRIDQCTSTVRLQAFFWSDSPVVAGSEEYPFRVQDQSPPAWVPASIENFTSLQWDISKSLAGARKRHDKRLDTRGGTQSFDDYMLSFREDLAGVDLESELLEHLTGRVMVLNQQPKLATSEDIRAPWILALEAKNAEDIQKSVLMIHQAPAAANRSRQVNQHTIYEGVIHRAKFELCIFQNHLLITQHPKLLNSILEQPAGSPALISDPRYQRLARQTSADTSYLYWSGRDNLLGGIMLSLVLAHTDDGESVPPAKLASLRKLRDQLSPGIISVQPEKHGFHLQLRNFPKSK